MTWLKALHGGKLLSQKSYTEMTTPSKLKDGTPLRYNMGLAIGKDSRGLSYIGHGGSITGFVSEANWYPDAQTAVIVLMNSNGNIDPSAVAGELAAELLLWTRPTLKQFAGDAAPRRPLQGSLARPRDGGRGDAGRAGARRFGERLTGASAAVGGRVDIPAREFVPDIPQNRRKRSGHGAALRRGARVLLHPQTAVIWPPTMMVLPDTRADRESPFLRPRCSPPASSWAGCSTGASCVCRSCAWASPSRRGFSSSPSGSAYSVSYSAGGDCSRSSARARRSSPIGPRRGWW